MTIEIAVLLLSALAGNADDDPVAFREAVAPILAESCVGCHNASTAKGGLDLSTAKAAMAGGDSGPAIVRGEPGESPLLDRVIPPDDGGRPDMPRKGGPLTAGQIDVLRRWIAEGAAWPDDLTVRAVAKAGTSWWSLRPLADASPPDPPGLPADWSGPIDRFVFAKLAEKGLAPNPEADRRTLLRRLSYDLTGLPPSPEEVATFEADPDPLAYEKAVDRLLASPRYGERWGRHWLDVVRFGESRGFERNEIIPNAWPFRDYVIRSLNDDKPFDQFVREHLAGDVVAKGRPEDEVGVAFLVAGPYDDVGNKDADQAAVIRANTIDDILRATGETFLGLTIGCARCHDHKFDPIRQEDYYALSATFAGVRHGSREVATPGARRARAEALRPLESRRKDWARARDGLRRAITARAEALAPTIAAGWTRSAPAYDRTEETFPPVEARFLRLVVSGTSADPSATAGYAIDELEVFAGDDPGRNVALATAGAKASGAYREAEDFSGAYAAGLVNDGKYDATWNAAGPTLTIALPGPERVDRVIFSANRNGGFPKTFPIEYRIEVSVDGEAWIEVASSSDRAPANHAHREKRLFDAAASGEERRVLGLIADELGSIGREIASVPPLPSWWAGTFEEAAGPFRVFLGGDPKRLGAEVVVASPSALADAAPGYALPSSASEADRRIALADWLVNPSNPLPPRVLANRVWQHHFGAGIVDTPSDFGALGGPPSHPELLDWLARRLHDHGWRLKPLHREVVTSRAYRQSSAWREDAAGVDAASRLLWRYPPRRLSAEEVRDTMLGVAGLRDDRMGGPGFRLFRYLQDNVATYVPLDDPGPETFRRSLYHHHARAARVDLLADFDCPDPAASAPTRAATVTPLQALTLLNHGLTRRMAGAVASRLDREAGPDPDARARLVFRIFFQRMPIAEEARDAAELIRRHGPAALARALLNTNEFLYLD